MLRVSNLGHIPVYIWVYRFKIQWDFLFIECVYLSCSYTEFNRAQQSCWGFRWVYRVWGHHKVLLSLPKSSILAHPFPAIPYYYHFIKPLNHMTSLFTCWPIMLYKEKLHHHNWHSSGNILPLLWWWMAPALFWYRPTANDWYW